MFAQDVKERLNRIEKKKKKKEVMALYHPGDIEITELNKRIGISVMRDEFAVLFLEGYVGRY